MFVKVFSQQEENGLRKGKIQGHSKHLLVNLAEKNVEGDANLMFSNKPVQRRAVDGKNVTQLHYAKLE